MRTIFKYLLVFVLVLSIQGCNKHAIQDAMVEFDQAFIPVFYYAYVGDLESAETAMIVLDRKWQKFQVEFETNAASSHNWQESFCMMDGWLDEARYAIKSNESLQALVQLDHARYELMDLRWREGIPYYLDKVWDLEASIDIVVQTSNDDLLDLLEWEEFLPMCFDVEKAWQALEAESMDSDKFKFNTTDRYLYKSRMGELKASINDFMVAVNCADNCEVMEAAKDMEVAYLNFLYVFGDFESTKSYFAAN